MRKTIIRDIEIIKDINILNERKINANHYFGAYFNNNDIELKEILIYKDSVNKSIWLGRSLYLMLGKNKPIKKELMIRNKIKAGWMIIIFHSLKDVLEWFTE